MKILISGGTMFVGRHITRLALEQGHDVTLFNRGKTNPGLFPAAHQLIGNRREDDLKALETGEWDAVIDVNGYIPRHVRDLATLLKGRVGHYTFISTVSVYAEPMPYHADEDAPLAQLEDPTTEEVNGETYGGLKVLCEQAALEAFPDQSTVVRPGLVVGPHDHTDRFTYWPVRVAQGGEVLAPVGPDVPVQFIDARDLAAFTLKLTVEKVAGVYNGVGPDAGLPIGKLLEACHKVSDSDAKFVYLPEDFLIEHEVQPWANLPLWLPHKLRTMATANIQRSLNAGLTLRPVEETVRDTLDWFRNHDRPEDRPYKPALDPEKEAAMLKAWYAKEAAS